MDRSPLDPPPIVVVVVGPPKVGKTTLIRCLIKNFTRQKLGDIRGPVTIVSGKCFHLSWIILLVEAQQEYLVNIQSIRKI